MISRALKLRFRRRLHIRKRQVEAFGIQAEAQIEENFFRRIERLNQVKRFVAGWLALTILIGACMVVQIRALGGYYQTLQPAAGGTYTEGIVGSFTNANPMYAASSVDQTVSHLVFSGLYTYNDRNELVGDLAAGPWEVNATATVYTVHLRAGLTWQDGQPLTADDVAFTYHVIQNPDAQSPLGTSWRGVTIAATDPLTITFTLPSPLSSFPYSMTNGIIPKHVLGNTAMTDMRSAAFNTSNPVGSGPFAWQTVEVTGTSPQDRQQQIALVPFQKYHAGAPKLSGFVVRTFRNQVDMIEGLKKRELTAISGLDSLPASLRHDSSINTYDLPLTAAVMTFFRTNQATLSDVGVRRALIKASDTASIIKNLGYPTKAVREPLLQGQLGYDPAYIQPLYDVAAANADLDQSGWVMGKDGIRVKNGERLAFKLSAENTSEYRKVARQLHDQWRVVGVDAEVILQNTADFQNTLTYHTYDALLYGTAIGDDPDVYAYWSSSQADVRAPNRLNFSEYSSKTADSALEAGRTRLDPALRIVKYRPFLQAWQADSPALGLYQPRVFYVTHGQVTGLNEHTVNSASDRYSNVNNWMIRQVSVSQATLK